jgi:hypothetical protein
MNFWKPTVSQFVIFCQIPGENELRIVRGFDGFEEANQELERLNKPTLSNPYSLNKLR